MQCNEIQQALVEAQYNHQQLAPTIEEHLQTCATCRAFQRASNSLDSILELDKEPPTVRPGFDTRFFARLEEVKKAEAETGLSSVFGKFQWWLAGALAGAAAITLMMFTPSAPQHSPLVDPDLSLAMELELVEEIDLLAQLEEAEDFDVLMQIESSDLDSFGTPASNTPAEKEEVRIQ